jgi:predicted transcriptional regulator
MPGSLPTVRDLMDKVFVRLDPEMQICDAIEILMRERITSASVVDHEGHVLGLLSEKDCLRVLVEGAYGGTPLGRVRDYMTRDFVVVPPDLDVFSLAQRFQNETLRRFFIVENGILTGQITRRDLLRAIQEILPKALEKPTAVPLMADLLVPGTEPYKVPPR